MAMLCGLAVGAWFEYLAVIALENFSTCSRLERTISRVDHQAVGSWRLCFLFVVRFLVHKLIVAECSTPNACNISWCIPFCHASALVISCGWKDFEERLCSSNFPFYYVAERDYFVLIGLATAQLICCVGWYKVFVGGWVGGMERGLRLGMRRVSSR